MTEGRAHASSSIWRHSKHYSALGGMKVQVRISIVIAYVVLLAACGLTAVASAAEDRPAISDFVFAMPDKWFLIPGRESSEGVLVFRRFSVAMHREDFEVINGRPQKIKVIGGLGQFYNSMIYFCQRSRARSDSVALHLPDQLSPASFAYGEWVSRLEVRVLADNLSVKMPGEYQRRSIC